MAICIKVSCLVSLVFPPPFFQNDKNVSALESRVFWLGLVATPIIWLFLLITSLVSLKFQWMVRCTLYWYLSKTIFYKNTHFTLWTRESILYPFFFIDNSNCRTESQFCQPLWLYTLQERCFEKTEKYGRKLPRSTNPKAGKMIETYNCLLGI